MTAPGDSTPAAQPGTPASTASTIAADASACAQPAFPDDRAARRAALRDLAAMIGSEVFY